MDNWFVHLLSIFPYNLIEIKIGKKRMMNGLDTNLSNTRQQVALAPDRDRKLVSLKTLWALRDIP